MAGYVEFEIGDDTALVDYHFRFRRPAILVAPFAQHTEAVFVGFDWEASAEPSAVSWASNVPGSVDWKAIELDLSVAAADSEQHPVGRFVFDRLVVLVDERAHNPHLKKGIDY